MKKLLLILFVLFSLFIDVKAQSIDRNWTIIEFYGEEWYCSKEDIIHQTQEFYKGWSDGAFYKCDYAGQSATYNKYTLTEFLNNPEFKLFKKYQDLLDLKDDIIFVHRITCDGDSNMNERRVLYPFITTKNSKKSYYIYEAGIFVLEYK